MYHLFIPLYYIIQVCEALKNSFFWYSGNNFFPKIAVAMGAKFAPSVAGHFMAKWEEEKIFSKPLVGLFTYKRYIDNIFVLWKGERVIITFFYKI